MNEQQRALADLIQRSERAVVFTGAGISTESGIPDYRSADTGLWNKIKPIEFQDFVSSEETRRESWRRRLEINSWTNAKPNAGHLAVAQFVAQGKVSAVITQNVDGLHQAAGVPDEQVIELHGNSSYCTCLVCGKRFEMEWVREVFSKDETVPYCDQCGGIVKSATISFGQSTPADKMQQAQEETAVCDLYLVMGSSLVVYPAAGFPELAKRNGARVVIINREPTDVDPIADLVIHGEIGPTISDVAKFLHRST
jgi:NAD-dependent deacetylase